MLVACCTIMQLVTMPLGGVTGGTQAIPSFNYGARQIERIRLGEKYILLLCLAFTSVMFVFSQFIPQFFVRIFTGDAAYVRLSVWGIRVFTACVIPLAFQYALVDGLTALGIAKAAVSLSLLRKFAFMLLTVALPAFFGAAFGAQAAFFAELIVDLCGGILSAIVFRMIFEKLLHARGKMPDGEALYR